ncbi:hypothetical protein OAP08_03890 [Akkermansiaceae bacterium]|nr:hypothetical protein [Akkermansiaceae bacterium]MDC0613609.1 hypothetical protein [Akkermansiaceae bacterium]
MPRKRKNSGGFYSNHVGNVEQTASGKFMVRARKRKIPTNEQEVTVETLESGKARLRKLDKLYLKKATVPLADIPDPQLHAADRARAEFYSRHKKAPKFEFGEVVAAGLESLRLKSLREKLPSIKESIAWFHEYRRTPDAKNRGLGTVSAKELRKEERAIKRLFERAAKGVPEETRQVSIESLLNKSVGELFDGTFFVESTKEGWFEFCNNHLNELKTQAGNPMGASTRSAEAMMLRTFCADVIKHNRARLSLPSTNPLQDLPSNHRYKRDPTAKITYQNPDKVRSLFKFLCEDAENNPVIKDKRKKGEFHDLLPYLALVYFSGRRQSEIGYWDKAHRRLNWSQFKNWSEPSEVSDGYLFTIPAFDEQGRRRGKKDHPTPGDLHKVGYQWLRYYFEGLKGQSALPNEGDIWFSATYMKKIRKMFEFEKNDIRHTFVSAAIKAYPRDSSYWHKHCAHTEGVAMRDYQNLMLSKPEAEEFFRIDPVSIVGWNDVTRRLFDPDGIETSFEYKEEYRSDEIDWDET